MSPVWGALSRPRPIPDRPAVTARESAPARAEAPPTPDQPPRRVGRPYNLNDIESVPTMYIGGGLVSLLVLVIIVVLVLRVL
jgi:hypothetical protein